MTRQDKGLGSCQTGRRGPHRGEQKQKKAWSGQVFLPFPLGQREYAGKSGGVDPSHPRTAATMCSKQLNQSVARTELSEDSLFNLMDPHTAHFTRIASLKACSRHPHAMSHDKDRTLRVARTQTLERGFGRTQELSCITGGAGLSEPVGSQK